MGAVVPLVVATDDPVGLKHASFADGVDESEVAGEEAAIVDIDDPQGVLPVGGALNLENDIAVEIPYTDLLPGREAVDVDSVVAEGDLAIVRQPPVILFPIGGAKVFRYGVERRLCRVAGVVNVAHEPFERVGADGAAGLLRNIFREENEVLRLLEFQIGFFDNFENDSLTENFHMMILISV